MKQLLLVLLLIVVGSVATLWLAPQGGMVAIDIDALNIHQEATLPIAIGVLVLAVVALAIVLRVLGWLLGGLARGIEGIGRGLSGGGRGRGGSVDSRMRKMIGQPLFTTTTLLFGIAFIAVGALVSVWIVNNDVPVTLSALDYEYQTSLSTATAAAVLLFLAILLVLRIVAWLLDLPGSFQRSSVAEMQTRDQIAILEGWLAVAARDAQNARKFFRRVSKQTQGNPSHLLLGAEIAKLEGDNAALLEHSHAMMSDPESELAGMHMLLDAARNEGNAALAASYAEQIQRRQPNDRWLLAIMVDLYAQAGDWDKLKSAAKKAASARVIDSVRASQFSVQADYALGAKAAAQGRMEEAEKLLKQAVRQDPAFLPAAVKLVDVAIRQDDTKQAVTVLSKAWAHNPHPELGDRLLQVYSNLSPRMQLDRAQRLTRKNPRHPESAAFVAQVALSANAPSTARRVLAEALKRHNTVRLCQLMLDAQITGDADVETVEYWAQRCTEAVPDSVASVDSYLIEGALGVTGSAPVARPAPAAAATTASPAQAATPQLTALPAPGKTA